MDAPMAITNHVSLQTTKANLLLVVTARTGAAAQSDRVLVASNVKSATHVEVWLGCEPDIAILQKTSGQL